MAFAFDLDFRGGDIERGQLPGAVAYISLRNFSRDESGQVHISHDCMGPAELEAEVTRLKAELDKLLRRGLRCFRDYEAKTKEAISRKREQQP